MLSACGGGSAPDGSITPITSTSTDTNTDTSTNTGTDTSSGTSSSSGVVGRIQLIAGAASITANGSDTTVIRATVTDTQSTDTQSQPVQGVSVSFTTTAGTLSATSAVTNSSGIAEVTLTAGTITGTANVVADASGFAASVTVTFAAGAVAGISLITAPATVDTAGSSSVTATVTDANANVISGETINFGFTAQGSGSPSLSSVVVVTDANGLATTTYTAGLANGIDTISATATNATTTSSDITVSTTAATINSVELTTGASTITADGSDSTLIRATVTDTDFDPVQGATVSFTTTAGTLSAATATSDTSGIAEVTLTSDTTPAAALVEATTGGFSDNAVVTMTAGVPASASSLITANPSTLPSDGASTAEVTVLLIDANNNLVTDGTPVTLQTTLGAIVGSSSATTASGRATFTLQAPSTEGTATLSLVEYPGITADLVVGVAGSGNAVNISTDIVENFLVVNGVGGVDNTSITINVTDETGNPVDDPGASDADNVRVSFLSQPNGGEVITGLNGSNTTSLDAKTIGGSVTLSLQTGTLPGPVELQIQVDETGLFSPAQASSVAPQISIASGPPHTIALSTPNLNSIENLGGGVYRRRGTLFVTDQFGNAVPDNTTINLGILDSIIVEGNMGQLGDDATNPTDLSILTDLSPTLTDGSATLFDTASITRNNITRFVEENDRVLLTGIAAATNKSRFVGNTATISNTTLGVQTNYSGTGSSLDYVVGASLLGAEISGINEATNTLTTGSVATTDGLAPVRVTYPANNGTIGVGCANIVAADTRYSPMESADVYMVASSTSDNATLVDHGTLCFAPIAGFTLEARPASISGSATVELILRDGGDQILLPFWPVTHTVVITNNDGNPLAISATEGLTDENGEFISTITISGADSDDTAVITFYAGDASVDVALTVP